MHKSNKPFRAEFYKTRRGDTPAQEGLLAAGKADQDNLFAAIDLLAEKRGKPEGLDIKKTANGVWRLRKGDWRVLYGIISEVVLLLSVFRKKQQRLELKEIRKALRYFDDYAQKPTK